MNEDDAQDCARQIINHLNERFNSYIVDLDDYRDANGNDIPVDDPAVTTLQMLTSMHQETHTMWRVSPNTGGAWNYSKA